MGRVWRTVLLVGAGLAGCCSSVEGAFDGGLENEDAGVGDGGDGGGGTDRCVVPSLVEQSLTLTRACAPWLVLSPVLVEGEARPVLSIAPGVVLAFASGTSLTIGMNHPGGLKAIGTPIQKKQGWVYFTTASGTAESKYWSGIVFGPQTLPGAEISWADIAYVGNDVPTRPSMAATIRVFGNDRAVHPKLADLTIEGSGRAVFAFVGPQAGFSTDSGRIFVPSWDGQNDGNTPPGVAFAIDPNQFDTLPADLVFGSTLTGIDLNCEYEMDQGLPCRIDHTATWMPPTISQLTPYPLRLPTHLLIGAPPGSAAEVTVTLAGEFLLASGSGIDVNTSQTNGRANLIADSAAFLGESIDAPWDGITFTVPQGGMTASSLTHCYFEGPRGVGEGGIKAGIFIDGRGTTVPENGPVIQDCTIAMADGGCDLSWDHIANGADYAENNDHNLQTYQDTEAEICHP